MITIELPVLELNKIDAITNPLWENRWFREKWGNGWERRICLIPNHSS